MPRGRDGLGGEAITIVEQLPVEDARLGGEVAGLESCPLSGALLPELEGTGANDERSARDLG